MQRGAACLTPLLPSHPTPSSPTPPHATAPAPASAACRHASTSASALAVSTPVALSSSSACPHLARRDAHALAHVRGASSLGGGERVGVLGVLGVLGVGDGKGAGGMEVWRWGMRERSGDALCQRRGGRAEERGARCDMHRGDAGMTAAVTAIPWHWHRRHACAWPTIITPHLADSVEHPPLYGVQHAHLLLHARHPPPLVPQQGPRHARTAAATHTGGAGGERGVGGMGGREGRGARVALWHGEGWGEGGTGRDGVRGEERGWRGCVGVVGENWCMG